MKESIVYILYQILLGCSNKEGEMVRVSSTCEWQEKCMHSLVVKPEGNNCLEELGINGRIILT
jgi:hypothetical protein